VVATYWAVFELGCATVGVAHAAIAVMLMVGVFVFSVPTPEFGPPVLAMALTALILLHFWWAAAQTLRLYWIAVGAEAGLLLLTSYAGLGLYVTLIGFMVITQRGRALLGSIEPWLAAILVVLLGFPHLIWLDAQGNLVAPMIDHVGDALSHARLFDRAALPARLLLAVGGLIVLVALSFRWGRKSEQRVPVFQRGSVHPFARDFIYTFAIVPLAIAVVLALILGEPYPIGGIAPMVVLWPLAVVVLAGDTISIHRQQLLGIVWGAMLVAPPLLAIVAVLLAPPLAGIDLAVTRPANAIGRYFSDAFERRNGKALEIVAGEPRLAALVALMSRPRASLYLDATPERSPWIDPQEVSRKGALVVWGAADTTGVPPAEIKTRFPELTPDVPRAFSRFTLTGTPTVRIGWGTVRPGASNQ
jgi:4-amino-4-deoxy-L-arabinose transferase-like glycosyltransferase